MICLKSTSHVHLYLDVQYVIVPTLGLPCARYEFLLI